MSAPLTASLCSVEGCGKPHRARGLCSKHYQHANYHGRLPPRIKATPEELLQFIEKAVQFTDDECLLWPNTNPETYGSMRIDGRSRGAHRVVCERVLGPRPSAKHEVAHGYNGQPCVGRACVNPQHLRWDTRKGNHADKIPHGTSQRGERNPIAKLTTEQVLQIRSQPHKPEAILAAEFGVDRSNIGLIRAHKSWAHIP